MNILLILLIFCLVLFFYLHIYFQLKTSEDLEIYEIEHEPSKERLEEICDLRQPVVFLSFNENDKINKNLLPNCTQAKLLSNYSVFDVKIRSTKKTSDISHTRDISNNLVGDISNDILVDDNLVDDILVEDESDLLYIPLPLKSALKALAEDKEAKYFSENNSEFLEESGLGKLYKYNDAFLRPPMTSNCIYDYITGSKGTQTPFRYEINYRNFFMVTEGEIKIKMTQPKSSKYLFPIKDYEYLEFKSPINPWKVQEQYKSDFEKIKCLEIILKKGQLFYLPAYWWYSFEFSNNEIKTSICSFKYRTYMNNVAILDKLFIYFLQSQNIKRKNMKLFV